MGGPFNSSRGYKECFADGSGWKLRVARWANPASGYIESIFLRSDGAEYTEGDSDTIDVIPIDHPAANSHRSHGGFIEHNGQHFLTKNPKIIKVEISYLGRRW